MEVALVKLLEALHQDTMQPLDDRWEEIAGWMDLPAGRINVGSAWPTRMADDLHAAIGRRNRVAH